MVFGAVSRSVSFNEWIVKVEKVRFFERKKNYFLMKEKARKNTPKAPVRLRHGKRRYPAMQNRRGDFASKVFTAKCIELFLTPSGANPVAVIKKTAPVRVLFFVAEADNYNISEILMISLCFFSA